MKTQVPSGRMGMVHVQDDDKPRRVLDSASRHGSHSRRPRCQVRVGYPLRPRTPGEECRSPDKDGWLSTCLLSVSPATPDRSRRHEPCGVSPRDPGQPGGVARTFLSRSVSGEGSARERPSVSRVRDPRRRAPPRYVSRRRKEVRRRELT